MKLGKDITENITITFRELVNDEIKERKIHGKFIGLKKGEYIEINSKEGFSQIPFVSENGGVLRIIDYYGELLYSNLTVKDLQISNGKIVTEHKSSDGIYI
ncbi:hypothetical protein K8R47_03405 [archaeon]|nr:hypothetical protein [archaeon]